MCLATKGRSGGEASVVSVVSVLSVVSGSLVAITKKRPIHHREHRDENLAALKSAGFSHARLVWNEHEMALFRARG